MHSRLHLLELPKGHWSWWVLSAAYNHQPKFCVPKGVNPIPHSFLDLHASLWPVTSVLYPNIFTLLTLTRTLYELVIPHDFSNQATLQTSVASIKKGLAVTQLSYLKINSGQNSFFVSSLKDLHRWPPMSIQTLGILL